MSLDLGRTQLPQCSRADGIAFALLWAKCGGVFMRSRGSDRLLRCARPASREAAVAPHEGRRRERVCARGRANTFNRCATRDRSAVTLWDELARPAPAPMPPIPPVDTASARVLHIEVQADATTLAGALAIPRDLIYCGLRIVRGRASAEAFSCFGRQVCAPSPGGHFFYSASGALRTPPRSRSGAQTSTRQRPLSSTPTR